MLVTDLTTETKEEFGANLSRAHESLEETLGRDVSAGEVARTVQHLSEGLAGWTDQTIRDYLAGKRPPEKASLELVCALAQIYDTPLEELSPSLARRRDLLVSKSRCTPVLAA